jgi:tetratricopeptide (TPR) repeat protein
MGGVHRECLRERFVYMKLREKLFATGDWSRRAARLAIGRYEIDEGLALLHRVVQLESDTHKQAELWREIGHANALKFDGESFRAAMEKAIELGGPSAELYTELALQTARRSGMWKRQPDRELIDAWVDRALELSEEGTPTRARALAAVALWRKDETAARALQAIAEQLGDVDLQSSALAALADVAWADGDYSRARPWVEERLRLLPRLSDPDDRHFAQMRAVDLDLATGRIPLARERSIAFEEMVQGLTPHHRLHGVSCRINVETFAGRWDDVRLLAANAERAVDANRETPCTGGVPTLLYCALASLRCGDDGEANRLEARANAQRLEANAWHCAPAKLGLAAVRNDHPELRRLLASYAPRLSPDVFEGVAAVLDALVALGDRERIDPEAPRWARSGTYLEPFALRALGFAHDDEVLLEQATARFEAMELDWHAEETRRLISQN